MRKFLTGIFMMVMLFSPTLALADGSAVEVPEEIYKWVQSTPRCNYYFNYQVMGYRVKPDNTLDLNTLIVPAICTYDDIQIQDVIQKRRWHMKSTRGYNDLIGRADYFEFDLVNNTVKLTERDDLDHTFTTLDSEYPNESVALSELSIKDVSCVFYRGMLKWAKENNDWMIQRSRGRLSSADENLMPQDMPIYKIPLPGN